MTLNIKTLKKSKIKYLLVFIVVVSMLFPSAVFAATGDVPILTPNITTSTTGKVVVTVTFPSGVDNFLSKQVSLDGGISWMDYTGPVSITDNTTMKAMYTYLNGSDTYSSQIGSLTISNITGRTLGDANNGNWAEKKGLQKNYTPEADAMVRIGDIDNFGFGFKTGYDPFSGNSTSVHAYPWTVPSDEPAGLDRIMEISGYNPKKSSGSDGYTTANGTVTAQSISMNYDLAGINVTSAKLQMFVDDFQAGIQADNPASGYYRAMDVAYVVTINGVEVTELSSYINQLNQSGPIGKLITFNLPANYIQLVRTGQLVIRIDDPTTAKYGDGYAIDFVKLLINQKNVTNTSSISGKVTDISTNAALSGAIVTACGFSTVTDNNGNYTLPKLAAGLAIVQATSNGYAPASLTKDLVQNNAYTGVNLKLQKTQKPGMPVISEDVLVPTSSSVNMTINYPDSPDQKKYSDHQVNGQDVWVDYIGSFSEAQNCTVKAKSISAASAGTVTSDIATYNITNIDKSIPGSPTLTPSTTAPTSGSVVVTATYPTAVNITVKQISVDGGATWTSYNGPVTIPLNTIVVAKCANNVGTESPEARLPITNIDKSIPATPTLTQDITALTNRDVTVTAVYPPEAVTKEISINGGTTWSAYSQPVVITQNTTVEARCTNNVGTLSKPGILIVTNIDKTVPPTPVLVEDNTRPTNANVNVTASFDQVAVIKEISVDNGITWSPYTGAVVISHNTTVKARCTNAAGTQSLLAELQITNIDKSVPAAPVITSSNPESTNRDVIVNVEFPNTAESKEISLDNGTNWKAYTGAETISANTTIFAKYKNALGTQSDLGRLSIDNIDKSIPDMPLITSDNTHLTNQDVNVTIYFPSTAHNEQVSFDNGTTWNNYRNSEISRAISVNTTVLAKYENYLGTTSRQGVLPISNINKTIPSAPTVSATPLGIVIKPNKVNVTVSYPENATNKKITTDNKLTWHDYVGTEYIKDNTTIYATYTNEYGTTSSEGFCNLHSFDNKPTAPDLIKSTIVPSTTVYVSIANTTTNSGLSKEYSLDGGSNWTPYVDGSPIAVTVNNTTIMGRCISVLGTRGDINSIIVTNIQEVTIDPNGNVIRIER